MKKHVWSLYLKQAGRFTTYVLRSVFFDICVFFFVFFSVCFVLLSYLFAVFGLSCLTLWSPPWGRGRWLLCLSLICDVRAVRRIFLMSLVGYVLWLWHVLDISLTVIFQRIKLLLKPSEEWGPSDSLQREIYRLQAYTYEDSFTKRFFVDIRGSKKTPWI